VVKRNGKLRSRKVCRRDLINFIKLDTFSISILRATKFYIGKRKAGNEKAGNENCLVIINGEGETIVITEEFEMALSNAINKNSA
jgi:hypothetical protein